MIEELAADEHASWARWMYYLFSKCLMTGGGDYVIPLSLALRWQYQAMTHYNDLSEQEKEYDREEVKHILPIIERHTVPRERHVVPRSISIESGMTE